MTNQGKVVKPQALKRGDKVALVAPASTVDGPLVLKRCVNVIEWMGFKPVVGKNVLKTEGFFAGSDKERLDDLMSFFADSSIKGIFCLSGGYGSLRLLSDIDYDVIAKNPKIIVGSDDNTALLLAIYKQTNLVVFNGPNLDQVNSPISWESLQAAVTQRKPLRHVPSRMGKIAFDASHYAPVEGTVTGQLLGGNLTAIGSLMGTPYHPNFDQKILFLEDRNERNDMLDRWFSTIYVSGDLNKVVGVALGDFVNCGRKGAANMLSIDTLLGDRLIELNKPSCFGLAFGQGEETCTLPVGINAKLNTYDGKLEFLEPALV